MSEEYTDWQDGELKLVRNREGICSIWPAQRENAPGWEDLPVVGSKAVCLAYVQEHCDASGRLKQLDDRRTLPEPQ